MAEETTQTTPQNGGSASNGSSATVQEVRTTGPSEPRYTNGSGPTSGTTPPGPTDNTPPEDAKKPGGRGKGLVAGLVVAALLAVGVPYGYHMWQFSRTHVGTDDAFVTGNLVNVSPLINGRLRELMVAEGDVVHKGQLIAKLGDDAQMAALRQAKAAYESALTQLPQAKTSLAYETATTDAAIARAQAALAVQEARTRAAGEQVSLANRTIQSQIAQAQTQVEAAQAEAAQAKAQVQTAQATVTRYQKAVTTAEGGVRSLEARVQAAQAEVDRVSKDEARYQRLLSQEAITQQQYDAVNAQLATAQSNLAALQQQIAQAQSQVDQARADVRQAEAQANAARQGAQAAEKSVQVARAGVDLARAGRPQVQVQAANREASETQGTQAQADIKTALAGKTQVELRRQQISTAEAAIKQAKANLENAQVQEDRTKIYAPSDGIIVKKAANVGVALSPGQTILTMTQGIGTYITANFKETQVGNVRVGQMVEFHVDAFPGKKFRGVVGNINAATGASTTLLPPDNATGNFTKVVQRIPIKIAIVPGDKAGEATAEDIALLRQGMSVAIEIDTQDVTNHPERVPAGYDRGGVSGRVVAANEK